MNAPQANAQRWRGLGVGFALGCCIFALLRALGGALLRDPCAGHTLWAMLSPLLLGPGGIAYATMHAGKGGGKAALGAGLAASSLFPALAVGALDLGSLRAQGCAGGYVVFSTLQGQKLPQLVMHPGERVSVHARPAGFRSPQPVSMRVIPDAAETQGVLKATVTPSVAPNTPALLQLEVSPQAPSEQYLLTLEAAQGPERAAQGELTITVRP